MVVSNTSPILNLAAIGSLDLLQRLYDTVQIPEAVRDELALLRAGGDHLPDFHAVPWLMPRAIADRPLVSALLLELDPGEAEAIALALELRAELVLLDERRGRRVARQLGLTPLGLLGVLVDAKRRGAVAALKPLLDDLIVKAGFWMGQSLYARVLAEVGEA